MRSRDGRVVDGASAIDVQNTGDDCDDTMVPNALAWSAMNSTTPRTALEPWCSRGPRAAAHSEVAREPQRYAGTAAARNGSRRGADQRRYCTGDGCSL